MRERGATPTTTTTDITAYNAGMAERRAWDRVRTNHNTLTNVPTFAMSPPPNNTTQPPTSPQTASTQLKQGGPVTVPLEATKPVRGGEDMGVAMSTYNTPTHHTMTHAQLQSEGEEVYRNWLNPSSRCGVSIEREGLTSMSTSPTQTPQPTNQKHHTHTIHPPPSPPTHTGRWR